MSNPAAVIIPGTGRLHVAPTGTGLPADIGTAIPAGFKDLGYLHEDGSEFSDGKTPGNKVFAWDVQVAVRQGVGSAEPYFQVQAREWSTDVLITAFGGGTVAAGTTGTVYTPPTGGLPPVLEVILDMTDGTTKYRLQSAGARVLQAATFTLAKVDNAAIPIRFDLEIPPAGGAPWQIVTDSAAVAVPA